MNLVALAFVTYLAAADSAAKPVVVASKPFGESYLLAELFAQLLEARGFRVDRRPGLGATEIAFGAVRSGDVDVYPEYTGTGLLAILHETPPGDRGAVYRRVAAEFRRRWDARWLPPLGFENTYAIAVRRATSDSLQLRTLSDLGRRGGHLRGGFTPDFIGRPDGLPGLTGAYGLQLAEVRALLPAVKYRALADGKVDVIDGYSTDGLLARYDLVVLTDDRAFFPPYEAAPLVSGSLARRAPAAIAALSELAGRLDVATMRGLNERLEVRGEPAERVAREALRALSLTQDTAAHEARTSVRAGSLTAYLWERRATIAAQTARHVLLVVIALGCAVLVAVPLGVVLERLPRAAEAVIRGVALVQTLPGIALLAFMIPFLGIGVVPALVALFLYSLFPIVRNTYSGVRDADPGAASAALALGMTPAQVLLQVRLPLAAPVIFAGIRTAGVLAVGTATLAGFIGAGGLGDSIVAGLALDDTRMVLSGAIPAAILALLTDGVLSLAERMATPRGVGPEVTARVHAL
ncbi:MAG TPA: glycine betaine ABC transporter substrate-binding protein [Gemmatimonadaceae bacterium]|nr:glycine betaine ABC transporter substrate-binding protein [Gemmatimonadaceae bacterium]